MNERYAATRRRPATMMVALWTILALLLGGIASADNVDKLVTDLTTGGDYKLRLSAAASLAKLGDKRAIPAFIKARQKDKEKTVRGAAAVGLGKVVTSATSADLKKKAMAALLKASKKDKDSFVKKQAKKAYEKLKKLTADEDDSSTVVGSSGGLYVDIGPMSSKTGSNDDKLREGMKKTIKLAFKKSGVAFSLGEGSASKGKTGFHVDGTLNEITETVKSGSVIIACKVSALIADYRGDRNPPEKSIFGNLSGGAKVTASDDEKDKAAAAADCVNAVLEDLVIKKMIPAIQTRAANP